MKISTNKTGTEFLVENGNLTLRQVVASGMRFNDCIVKDNGNYQFVGENFPGFKEMFMALSSFKR